LVEDPRKICEQKTVIAFDFVDWKQEEVFLWWNILWVVWPEWHFGEKDYVFLREVGYVPCSLGEHILRTETAAIVWAWYLCNMK
jgi:16S rRNA U1498 N3-methylase RsmE